MCGNQEGQFYEAYTGAILSRFSDEAAVDVWNTSLECSPPGNERDVGRETGFEEIIFYFPCRNHPTLPVIHTEAAQRLSWPPRR
jgi:hypothetical protein